LEQGKMYHIKLKAYEHHRLYGERLAAYETE
jgi:hypothetical protein